MDQPIRGLHPAPAEGVNDTGNVFDTDETLDKVLEHNARLAAACPSPAN